jgi:hypothetical protein
MFILRKPKELFMGANMQVSIEPNDGVDRLHRKNYDANVEQGMFLALADLIRIENNLIWDPVGAFFSLTGGYRIHKYKSGGGAVFDSDDQEIFLTDDHIDALFRIAHLRGRQIVRGRHR